MNSMTLSIMKIKQSITIRCQQVVVWAVLVVLLASSLALAQIGSVSPQPRKPSPRTEPATPGSTAEVASTSRYVDGGAPSICPRTGDKDCVRALGVPPRGGQGPFRQVGEGVKYVSPGDTLFIKAGSYPEPIVLNKKMEIRAYDGPVTIGPSSLLSMDLVADTVDDNGLPLNPKWGAQRNNPPELPKPTHCFPFGEVHYNCIHQFIYLNDANVCGPHINWFGATYEGNIKWDGHECPVGGDDDYNMLLMREDSAGYTAGNSDSIKCEFDSGETIDHFSTPWWTTFQKTVDAEGCHCPIVCSPDNRAGVLIDGSYVIVTGLVGLDVEHSIHSEIHPVWALAMNVQPSVDDDLWAFFVRNYGNEGFCGTSQEFIDFPNNTYTFRIPWRKGATSVSLTDQTRVVALDVKNPSWTVRPVPGKGVFVTFTLDPPRDNGSLWEGELHLQWGGQGIAIEPRAKLPKFTARQKREKEVESAIAPKKEAKKRAKREGIVVKPIIVNE